MRRFPRAWTVFPCVLLLLWSEGWALAAAEREPVRIGLTREASAAPLLVAIAAGHFAAEGLDPRLSYFATDHAVAAAAASGKVDVGLAGLSASFYGFAAAHGLKMIASRSTDRSGFPMYALLVSKRAHDAGLTGIRRLPGARIGIAEMGSGPYFALYSVASRFHLDFASIKTIPLQSTAGEREALSRGEIDAALLPYAVALRSAKRSEPLLLLGNFVAWQEGVVFTTAAALAARRPLVERFMRAYQQGAVDYHFNFLEYDDAGDFIPGPRYDAYLRAIAAAVRRSPDFVASTKTYCDRRANLDMDDIAAQVRFWQEQNRLDKRIAAGDLVDLSFIGDEAVTPPPLR
ncbi:MAG TPA: ABC transporter substrate-binding protein [Stellaceae bacterium]|nr:ABC transporter substrate-binding protein [Stellaceae bacterium]